MFLIGRLDKTVGLMKQELRTNEISVIMPIYKTKVEHLRLAIQSVLAQSFSDFEFIILNDSPQDKRLKEIVDSFADNRIKYFENEVNLGIAKSYNKLLDLAKGKYIALMNHDDEMKKERLKKQYEFLEKNSDVGLVGTAYKKFGEVNRFKNILCPKSHDEILAMFLFKSPVHHPTIMMRGDIIKKYNIRYNEEFISLNDRQLCWEFSKYSRVSNLDEVLYKYRFHPDMTSKKMKMDIRKERAKFHKLWFEYNDINLSDDEVDGFDNYVTFGSAKINDKSVNSDGYVISNYVNKITLDIKKELNNNGIDVLVLGNGNRIIGQYPSNSIKLYNGDRVVLLTNEYDKKMINFIGMSYKDANNILNLMGVKYKLEGYGYVYEQNIEFDKKIDGEVVLKLKEKY